MDCFNGSYFEICFMILLLVVVIYIWLLIVLKACNCFVLLLSEGCWICYLLVVDRSLVGRLFLCYLGF